MFSSHGIFRVVWGWKKTAYPQNGVSNRGFPVPGEIFHDFSTKPPLVRGLVVMDRGIKTLGTFAEQRH